MFKKIVAIASSIIVSTICLTGCDFNSDDKKDESSSSKNLDKVTIAEVTHSVFYAPQYAAITKGFFEDEGIKIDLINHTKTLNDTALIFLRSKYSYRVVRMSYVNYSGFVDDNYSLFFLFYA